MESSELYFPLMTTRPSCRVLGCMNMYIIGLASLFLSPPSAFPFQSSSEYAIGVYDFFFFVLLGSRVTTGPIYGYRMLASYPWETSKYFLRKKKTPLFLEILQSLCTINFGCILDHSLIVRKHQLIDKVNCAHVKWVCSWFCPCFASPWEMQRRVLDSG